MKNLFEFLIIALVNLTMTGQELRIEKPALSDTASVAIEMQNLAKAYLQKNQAAGQEIEANDLYRIQILAGNYKASIKTIQSLRENSDLNQGHPSYMPYELFSKAKMAQLASDAGFNEAYQSVFKAYLANCNDEQAYTANIVFTTYDAVAQFTKNFETHYNTISDTSMNLDQARDLLKSYFLYDVYTLTEPIVNEEIKRDENKRYIIKEEVIISARDGAELTVI